MTDHGTTSCLNRLIDSVESGDMQAADDLLPDVYDELRRLARIRLMDDRAGRSLAPTELVHEAYQRLLHGENREPKKWNGRAHFFGAASEAMRRILIDRARARTVARRGGGWHRVGLSSIVHPAENNPQRLVDLDEALGRLEKRHPEKATLVKMRFFMGMTMDQIAEALEVSPATAARHWAFARAWLKTEIDDSQQ